jgi:sterol desaturase/sphingolipid hydroxylase (fatty acid hydroxylase superfamily)
MTTDKVISFLQGPGGVSFSSSLAVDAAFALALLVAADFGFWLSHLCLHRISFLWEFHRVHHSASALNLFTSLRLHPVEKIMVSLFQGGAIAAFIFLVSKIMGYVPTRATIHATPVVGLVLWAQGIFRHSPLRLGYGRFSYLVSSPVMHHAHHSVDRDLQDKNFGHFFSIWDLLWGSFYLPKRDETFVYGLSEAAVPNVLGVNLLAPLRAIFGVPAKSREAA